MTSLETKPWPWRWILPAAGTAVLAPVLVFGSSVDAYVMGSWAWLNYLLNIAFDIAPKEPLALHAIQLAEWGLTLFAGGYCLERSAGSVRWRFSAAFLLSIPYRRLMALLQFHGSDNSRTLTSGLSQALGQLLGFPQIVLGAPNGISRTAAYLHWAVAVALIYGVLTALQSPQWRKRVAVWTLTKEFERGLMGAALDVSLVLWFLWSQSDLMLFWILFHPLSLVGISPILSGLGEGFLFGFWLERGLKVLREGKKAG